MKYLLWEMNKWRHEVKMLNVAIWSIIWNLFSFAFGQFRYVNEIFTVSALETALYIENMLIKYVYWVHNTSTLILYNFRWAFTPKMLHNFYYLFVDSLISSRFISMSWNTRSMLFRKFTQPSSKLRKSTEPLWTSFVRVLGLPWKGHPLIKMNEPSYQFRWRFNNI